MTEKQKNCCLNCDKRKIGCASTCPDYAALKEYRQLINDARQKDKAFVDYRRQERTKIQRIKNKNKKGCIL